MSTVRCNERGMTMPPAGRLRVCLGGRILSADLQMSWEKDYTRRSRDALWSVYPLQLGSAASSLH